MANHQVPRTATRVEQVHGVDADGNVITAVVFSHTRAGHAHPVFYLVQYRERSRRIMAGSRVTEQFGGESGRARLDVELAETRRLLAESRVRASRRQS